MTTRVLLISRAARRLNRGRRPTAMNKWAENMTGTRGAGAAATAGPFAACAPMDSLLQAVKIAAGNAARRDVIVLLSACFSFDFLDLRRGFLRKNPGAKKRNPTPPHLK